VRFFYILIFSLNLFANDIQLETPASFTANYIQKRYIKSSDIELNSKGLIIVKDKEELIWKQIAPFGYTIVLTGDKIVAGRGRELKELDNPIIFEMSQIIFKVMKGDFSELKRNFKAKYQKKNKEVVFHPIDKSYKKFISRIIININKNVQRFRFFEKSGNYIDIKFSNYKLDKSK